MPVTRITPEPIAFALHVKFLGQPLRPLVGRAPVADCMMDRQRSFEVTEVLQGLDCDELQGYLLGKPLTAEAFTRLLVEEKAQSNLD